MEGSSHHERARCVGAVMLTFAAGCSVLDPELYKNAEQGWAAVADACPFPDAQLLSSDIRHNNGVIALSGLADDIQNCAELEDFAGPDGVIGISAAAGELVYLEVDFVREPGDAAPPIDLGIYPMNACDANSCGAEGVERCPPGVGENLAWVAPGPGAYYFGFDAKAYDIVQYTPMLSVDVTFPRCGDGVLDKAESCDDGNIDDGDGCASECLAELANGGEPPIEVEPNNHYTTANVVRAEPGEIVTIKGHIGGGCDNDNYFLDVPEGGFARVKMLDGNGNECPPGTPEIEMEFDDPSGVADIGDAEIPAKDGGTNYCPEFDENTFPASSLPAGRYVVEMYPFNKGDMPQLTYVLQVEVTAAPGDESSGDDGSSTSNGSGSSSSDAGAESTSTEGGVTESSSSDAGGSTTTSGESTSAG